MAKSYISEAPVILADLKSIVLLHLAAALLVYTAIPWFTVYTSAGGAQYTRVFYPLKDAVVYEDDPDRNFGFNWEIGVNYMEGFRDRSFIMFDLSSIPPGSIIVSAFLNIYMYDPPDVNRSLACYQVTEGDWREDSITWRNQPAASLFVASVSTGDKPKWLKLDVKSSLVKFVSGSHSGYEPNFGWMLRDYAEGTGSASHPFWMCSREHKDSSKHPYLEVKYSPPRLDLVPSGDSMQAGGWVKMRVYRETAAGERITRGPLRVRLDSNSNSTSRKFSLTQGGDAITELTIREGATFADFYYYEEKAGTWSVSVKAVDYPDYVGDAETLRVTPGPLEGFEFEAIDSPKQVAIPFQITIIARDTYGNVKTDYNGVNTLSDTTGTISPNKTGVFANGKWSGTVTISRISGSVRITTTGLGKTGESNLFQVTAGPPAKLVIEPSSFKMAAGIVYQSLRLSLRDVKGFEANNTLNVAVSLSTSSPQGEFRLPGTAARITSVTIPAGSSTVQVDYFDTMVGNHTLTASAIGFTFKANVTVLVDRLPPATVITIRGPKHEANGTLYVSGSTLLLFTAEDDLSGVKKTFYRVDENPWEAYNTAFTLSPYSEGRREIRYYSVDRADNAEAERKLELFLDKSPPSVKEASPSGRFFSSSRTIFLIVKAADPSGVRDVELTIDGIPHGFMVKNGDRYIKSASLSEGSHSWSIRLTDNLNNSDVYSYSFTLIIDTRPPLITSLTGPSNPVFGEAATVVCTVSDEPSGVREVYLYYSTDKGSSWVRTVMTLEEGLYKGSIPSQFFFTEVQYYVEAVDNAGNRFQTGFSTYTVGIPLWLYLLAISLIVIPLAASFLRRMLARRRPPQLEYTASGTMTR
ncbi:MAG: DNRLRE domain-containing protein [Thermoproteota archaeon]